MQKPNVTALSFAAVVLVASLVSVLFLAPQAIPNVGAVTSVGVDVYWDSACTNTTTSISWGAIEPGGTRNQTVYIMNNEPLPVNLSIDYADWTPDGASSYITPSWNCTNYYLGSGSVVAGVLTLTASQNASEITSFGFDIVITGIETDSANEQVKVSLATSGLPAGVNVTFTVNNVNHTGTAPYTYSELFNSEANISFSASPKILGASGIAYFFKGWKNESNNAITSSLTVSASHTYYAQYQMQYVGTLTATVKDASYKAVPNASIYLDGNYAGLTDSNGKLVISTVPTGPYTLSANKEEYNAASTTTYVNRGWTTCVTLTLKVKTYSLTAYVQDQNGNMVPYAYAYLNSTYKGMTSYYGKLVISGVARGNYTLRFSKSSYLDYTSPITILSDTGVNATLTRTYTITVMVKDSATALTIRSANVYVDGVSIGSTDYYYGKLVIRNVTQGPHTFTIKKTGYADNSTSKNVASDTTITITLAKR